MKKVALKIMLILILIIILVPVAMMSFCPFSGPVYKGPVTDHFNGEEFHNLDKDPERGFLDFFKWQLDRDKGYWKEWINSEYGPKPIEKVKDGELLATFINHSTVLIQTDGLNILTDPVWSYRVSPVSWIGPTRHRNPGVKFEDLPKIHIVVVSHNHYDHMDIPTLKRIYDEHKPLFLVPLGNKVLLEDNCISNVKEMDWWEETIVNGSKKITFVPARHFSMRGTCDRNKTLWGGWVIHTEKGPVYFAGDTGFGIHFKMIRDRFGPMRLSLLPIGAYRPMWFMKTVHVSPKEAVEAHRILESGKTMGIHFGCFPQADDGLYEPVNDLKAALKELKVSARDFFVPTHGKSNKIQGFQEFRITR